MSDFIDRGRAAAALATGNRALAEAELASHDPVARALAAKALAGGGGGGNPSQLALGGQQLTLLSQDLTMTV